MKRLLLVIGIVCLALAPIGARADILDPPDPLNGQKTMRLFTVPGVVSAGGLATFFSCTNMSAAPATVSVALYVDGGGEECNDPNAVALTLEPGGTRLFATQNTGDSSYFSTQPLSAVPGLFISVGSASILSTSKSVFCTAFVADVSGSPPSAAYSLHVIGKKQK